MAGVLEQLFWPQKRAEEHCASRMSPKAMELEAAREILAEVFSMRISEVEEMLRQRSETEGQSFKEKDGLWPESFSLE